MKYAYYDHTAAQPTRVLGWYHVRDETDPDGEVYAQLPPSADLLAITDDQWSNRGATPYVDNGSLVAAPAPTQDQIDCEAWAAYRAKALNALADSDLTVARVAEAVALGATTWTTADVAAWMTYRRDLRAILSQTQPATIPADLPAAPPFPAGT